MKSLKLMVVLIVLASLCTNADAQRLKLFSRTKPEEKPQALELTQRAGPWLIMCTSFTGEDGQQQAARLAKELRGHGVNAYIYSHKFDFEREVQNRGMGWEAFGPEGQEDVRPQRMRPAGVAKFEEIAVLVGDFATIEDAKAQATLAQVKNFIPKSMADYDVAAALKDESLAGSRLRAWRDFAGSSAASPQKNSIGATKSGPLRAAFLIPNPLLPEDYFAARKLDDHIVRTNLIPKNSLLKNSGTYSIRIATFDGETFLESDQIARKQQENEWLKSKRKARTESKLINAAKKAHVLTETLRKQGIEAWEFHDKHESYVCVGAFDWLVRVGADGRKESNPDMVAVIQKFKGNLVNANGQQAMTTYKLPDKLVQARISCDVQPVPVLIPKATSTQLASKKRFGFFK